MAKKRDPLQFAQPAVQRWFSACFGAPTKAQRLGWPPIAQKRSTLLLAPTGSGKTLTAFLAAIDRLMFSPEPELKSRCRVLYISPLKALGADVERNLRAPLAGIAAAALRAEEPHRIPAVGVRSGDTPSAERAKMVRKPPDILITTPESLYLMLTSNAREILGSVETVIIDEIHSMVPTKRGTHLFLSLERLEALRRPDAPPLQRIGLSATQRPLDEVARLLGGGTRPSSQAPWTPRPVEIINASDKKDLALTIEVPVEDMTQPGNAPDDVIIETESFGASGPNSIWPSIHPRLVELIKSHRSTMLFVNSRRLSERLAGAINEVAEEEIAMAHHGSVSKEKRKDIEDRLKRGDLPAIVATSSLELGIDMGAVDLVIQIEAPPSVASGLQRIGRAGHSVGETSKGVIFPKYRGDLLACAAASDRMLDGKVEETFYPRNPLDVLAQQIVAIVSSGPLAFIKNAPKESPIDVEVVYDLVRQSAPFAELPRSSFEGVLDMLSGRYPSDEFSELRARITWDRIANRLTPRQGAKRTAVINGGTIPDRGLYGVFLAGDEGAKSRRVGELDEEMVFESRPGEVFLLGASSWRIEDITHDKVLVIPAPGQPGKMPFWRGDGPGRPPEFGQAIGALSRKLLKQEPEEAAAQLHERNGLDERAAKNLLAYLRDQVEATGDVPTDRTLILERFVDEIGDWRVCLLSPFGARVHAPWATAVMTALQDDFPGEVDMVWSDDGIVFRLPEADNPPDERLFFPAPELVESLIVRNLGETSMFAARFRENAGRALLLPKRYPGKRTPLWAQRKKAADLLSVASAYSDFPIVLETYRECLKDVFDLPGLVGLLRKVQSRKIKIRSVESKSPSPFAAALMFSYVANFLYNGDAPLAERRTHALSIDHAQLRELLGEEELRELFELELILELERGLQRLGANQAIRHQDHLHDMLLQLGPLSAQEIRERAGEHAEQTPAWIEALVAARRIIRVTVAGVAQLAAAEDAGRLRDALGVLGGAGLPEAFLEPVEDPLGDLISRYARTHGPFTAEQIAERFALGVAPVRSALLALAQKNRVIEGCYIPGRRGQEWCDAQVLRTLKRRALATLRKQVEPVEPPTLGRFLADWHGITNARRGLDALLNAIEKLQGAPLPASTLEEEILPARVSDYSPAMLDELCAAGEVMWRGVEPIGSYDGRIALYLTDHYQHLCPVPTEAEGSLQAKLRTLLMKRGALFFNDLTSQTGAFPADLMSALWDLVWAGEVTNDTLAPLRSLLRASSSATKRPGRSGRFRSRRRFIPGTEGRWTMTPHLEDATLSITERQTARCIQLLERHGVLTKEAVKAEGQTNGFAGIYPVLKAMEEGGKLRRGYFVAGLGATQFALPGAEDRLRGHRELDEDEPDAGLLLAATDPANPYGSALPWPQREGAKPQRAAGAQVVLWRGALLAFLGRTERSMLTFLPEEEPTRSQAANILVRTLDARVLGGERRAILISKIDGEHPKRSFLAPFFAEAGFSAQSRGFLKRR